GVQTCALPILIPLKQTRIHVGILYQHGIQKTFLIWHYHLVIHFFSFMFIMENYHVNFIREVRIYFCLYHSLLLVMHCLHIYLLMNVDWYMANLYIYFVIFIYTIIFFSYGSNIFTK